MKRIWTYILFTALALFAIGLVSAQFNVKSPIYNGASYDMSQDWINEDGVTVSLSELPEGNITLTHSLSDMELMDKSFCLKSSDTFISVMVDGRNVYEYKPTYPSVIGHSYGNYVHMIPLPPSADTLTVTLTPVYDGDVPDLRAAAIEDPAKFITDLYRQGLPEFIACLIMAVFGLIMIMLEFTGGYAVSEQTMGFGTLGVFSIIIGIWSMNDTFILQSFTERPEVIKIVCYLCIMMIAYPPVSFVASAAKRRDTKLLPVLAVLIIINFITTVVLGVLGKVDPHYMLLFSHFNILVAMCMTIYLMVQAARSKTIEKRFLRTIIIGMTAALIGVGIDLLRFWFAKNSEYGASPFTRVGVMVFIIAEGIYLLKEKNRLIVERGNAELMKKLAYTDILTGLANRLAFSEKEKELSQAEDVCTIVLLDINYLKKVNDEYGHAEGDKHIIAAADVIKESLSQLGICYRIGGDEFAAILDTDDADTVKLALERLEQAENTYNEAQKPPVLLQLAYGHALYFPKNMSPEIAEGMADRRMYEMKRIMKGSEKPAEVV